MAKPAKPAPQQEAEAPPKKSKKMLIIIITAVVLLVGGGAAAFLLLKPQPPREGAAAEVAAHIEEEQPKFVELGTFTANLMHEEGDRYLQVAITLKVTRPELEEKIKTNNPEILHRVNMVLQSKRPSELATFEGKDKLAQQIKGQVEYVLGLRKVAPAIVAAEAPAAEAAPGEAPAAAPGPAAEAKAIGGIAGVLFTSFIIQ